MSTPKPLHRFPSVHLTIKDCKRSQSSRSSLSDMAWSDSSAADRFDTTKHLQLAQDSLSAPSALLEHYNDVFTQISALKAATGELIAKVGQVLKYANEETADSVHCRLFCMLSDKLGELSAVVQGSGFCEIAPSAKNKRNFSMSHFKDTGNDVSETASNLVDNNRGKLQSLSLIHI